RLHQHAVRGEGPAVGRGVGPGGGGDLPGARHGNGGRHRAFAGAVRGGPGRRRAGGPANPTAGAGGAARRRRRRAWRPGRRGRRRRRRGRAGGGAISTWEDEGDWEEQREGFLEDLPANDVPADVVREKEEEEEDEGTGWEA